MAGSVMARIGCILLCAIAAAIIAFLLVVQSGAKRVALAKSTLLVSVGKGHGSGVHIGNRFVITAAHVVGQESEVVLSTSKGDDHPADVLWVNSAHDVALLRSRDELGSDVSRLACDSAPQIGQRIEAIGNPGKLKFVHSWGRVAGPVEELFRWKVAFIADLGIAPGSSGGPVIDERGRVAGIVVGVSVTYLGGMVPSPTNYSVIVPSQAVCSLLARNS